MEYNELMQSVRKFNFIGNEERADAAVKATMGIVASNMSEEDAKEFVNYLPEPLTLDRLRNHQVYQNKVSPKDHIQIVATQFNIAEGEAQKLVENVLSATKQGLSQEQVKTWKQKMPEDWSAFLDKL